MVDNVRNTAAAVFIFHPRRFCEYRVQSYVAINSRTAVFIISWLVFRASPRSWPDTRLHQLRIIHTTSVSYDEYRTFTRRFASYECKVLKYNTPQPVAPVAYQVILEPGIGQFRDFESPRVHTRINSWGFFLAHKLTCGKRESAS